MPSDPISFMTLSSTISCRLAIVTRGSKESWQKEDTESRTSCSSSVNKDSRLRASCQLKLLLLLLLALRDTGLVTPRPRVRRRDRDSILLLSRVLFRVCWSGNGFFSCFLVFSGFSFRKFVVETSFFSLNTQFRHKGGWQRKCPLLNPE